MRWEYKLTEIMLGKGIRVHEEKLNAFGRDGWEIVAVWPEEKNNATVQRVMMKRPFCGSLKLPGSGGRNYLFGPRS